VYQATWTGQAFEQASQFDPPYDTYIYLLVNPYPTQAAALAAALAFPTNDPVNWTAFKGSSGTLTGSGWWALRRVGPVPGGPGCHFLGVDCRCWPFGPPAHWTAAGGGKQSGSAVFAQGAAWTAAGGGKQSGSAVFAQGAAWTAAGGGKQSGRAPIHTNSSWTAAGGGKQDGAAVTSAAFAWTAAGGGKQNGAAVTSAAFAWTAAGGGKQDGAAVTSAAFAWTAAGGGKQNGAAVISAQGTLYCQSTNTDTTCDVAADTSQDLGAAVGSGSSSKTYSASAMTERIIWDVLRSGKTGTYNVSLNVNTLNGTSPSARFRIQAIDNACAVQASSAYSSTFTTTGIKTAALALTWPGTGTRLRISLESTASGIGPKLVSVTDDANSFTTVPL